MIFKIKIFILKKAEKSGKSKYKIDVSVLKNKKKKGDKHDSSSLKDNCC